MAGYDPADPITAMGVGHKPGSYTTFLKTDAPKGKRIGVLGRFFGRDAVHAEVNAIMETDIAAAKSDGMGEPAYAAIFQRRDALRKAVMFALAENHLDAIMYPHQKRLVAAVGEDQLERNGVLSNATGFPAITVPGGFSHPTGSAPIGVPVGVEFLGGEWSEGRLIAMAYAFEQGTRFRKPPKSTPPLR